MPQTAIPFLFFRGGTSRGPFLQQKHLPEDRETLKDVLIAMMGSGHPLNIDGLGGGSSVTTKVAILSPGTDGWADVNYLFAQVQVEDKLVDFKPTCGNMLSAVGPAALEMGLLDMQDSVTEVKILSVNTGAKVVAKVQTPNQQVDYAGETSIAGVPGTAAPIPLSFMDVVGNITHALLPTGKVQDVIDGIAVTCIEVGMPLVIAKASSFGLSGYESRAALDENRSFFERMEKIRIQAGEMMGLGNVKESVIPKFAVVAPPSEGGNLAARYFMPWNCHPSMAVTGGQCIASCALTPGSVAATLLTAPTGSPVSIAIEHPSGQFEVLVDYELNKDQVDIRSAGVMRTARKIAAGELFIPSPILSG